MAAIAQAENFFKSSLFSFENFNATYVVHFHDNSQRTYVFDSTKHKFVPVPGTARDSHGQLIPENLSMATNGYGTGAYRYDNGFPTYDLTNLESLLRGMGADMPPATQTYPTVVTCTWDGKTLACKIAHLAQ